MLNSRALLLALLGLCSVAAGADTQAWKSRSIYFALTDRVAIDGQGGGDACGDLGTFKGLQSKLDYIKGMGFDAIWITPVVASKTSLSDLVVASANLDAKTRQRRRLPWILGTGPLFCKLELWHSR